jgi:hypothetical protein
VITSQSRRDRGFTLPGRWGRNKHRRATANFIRRHLFSPKKVKIILKVAFFHKDAKGQKQFLNP